MTSVTARCPACDGVGDPYGEIGSRMVFKCRECSVRFKGAATALIRRRQKQADV